MHNFYAGEVISRIGLFLAALILATIFILRAQMRMPFIRPYVLGFVVWRSLILAFHIFWFIPNTLRDKGGMDAVKYHYDGLRAGFLIRQGTFAGLKLGLGTKMMGLLTGLIYTPFGADFYGLFAVSAAFSIIAMLLQLEAFCIWYEGEHAKIYFLLLAFFPSYAIWSSLAGKDSWVALGLGMVSLGYSRVSLKPSVGSIILAAIGLGLVTIIRPHVALIIVVAIATASLLKSSKSYGRQQKLLAPAILRIASLLVLLLPLVFLLDKITSSFVKQDIGGSGDILKVESRVAQGNSYGGSAVEAHTVNSPLEFLEYLPEGLTRIYLRPFIGEGHNGNMVLAGIENAFLTIFLFRLLRAGPMRYRFHSNPLALFCVMVTIGLSLLFSMLTNFGLISRERAQLLPFLFAIFAIVIPVAKSNKRLNARSRSKSEQMRYRQPQPATVA